MELCSLPDIYPGQTVVEVMKIIVTSLKRSHAFAVTVHAPNPAAGHRQPMPSPETPRHPQASLLWVHCSFLLVLVHKVLLCPPRVYCPVLCKFWQLCGGVNGNLLQEELCHTHSQSPCSCSRPLLTHTSTGDTQAQFIYVRSLKYGFCTFYFFAGYVAKTRVHRFRYSV